MAGNNSKKPKRTLQDKDSNYNMTPGTGKKKFDLVAELTSGNFQRKQALLTSMGFYVNVEPDTPSKTINSNVYVPRTNGQSKRQKSVYASAEGVSLSRKDVDDWTNKFKNFSISCTHEDFEKFNQPQPSKSKSSNFSRRRHRKNKKRSSKTRHILPFLSLPRELRDIVYDEVIDLSKIAPNCKEMGLAYLKEMCDIDQEKEKEKMIDAVLRLKDRFGNMKTPNVLLINRQIYKEAVGVLRKRSLTFDGAPINAPDFFPLAALFSPGLLRKIQSINFKIPMKQHTEATMAGDLEHGNNWWHHSQLDSLETLDSSQMWAFFLYDIIAMLWKPHHNVQRMTISIGKVDYVLKPDQRTLSGLDHTITACLVSRNLEHFVAYLGMADIRKPKDVDDVQHSDEEKHHLD